MRCWVIFTNKVDHWLARLLKKGFRHCLILVQTEREWYYIDLASNYLDIQVLPIPQSFPYADWLQNESELILVESDRTYEGQIALGLYTCVTMVKQFLGIRSPLTLTPYQLYKKLKK